MKKILIALTCSTLFLSSCIKMDTDYVINDDLSLDANIRVDYTVWNQSTEGLNEGLNEGFGGTSSNSNIDVTPCDNLQSGSGGVSTLSFLEETCINIDDNIAEFNGKGASIEAVISENKGNYKLDIIKLISENNEDSTKTQEEQATEIKSLQNFGLEFNYTINFPGDIIESNVGDIDGNILSFDIYEAIDVDDAYVRFTLGENVTTSTPVIDSVLVGTDISRSKFKKQSIVARSKLSKSSKTQSYISEIDSIIGELSNAKLNKVVTKIQSITFESRQNQEYKDIIDYLEAQIMLKLISGDEVGLFPKEEVIEKPKQDNATDIKIAQNLRGLMTVIDYGRANNDLKLEETVVVQSSHNVVYNSNDEVVYQGTINFGRLRQNPSDFLDSNGDDYIIAYIETSEGGFYEIGAILAETQELKIVGDYKKLTEGDSERLIK